MKESFAYHRLILVAAEAVYPLKLDWVNQRWVQAGFWGGRHEPCGTLSGSLGRHNSTSQKTFFRAKGFFMNHPTLANNGGIIWKETKNLGLASSYLYLYLSACRGRRRTTRRVTCIHLIQLIVIAAIHASKQPVSSSTTPRQYFSIHHVINTCN